MQTHMDLYGLPLKQVPKASEQEGTRMTKDEALRLALEALEPIPYKDDWTVAKETNKAITAIKEALANEALDKMAENARELGLDYEPAQPFITHNVEQPYDWSEWVCPDPKGYLMKCCDCGLVHEAQFGVVRYKSETERDDCDMVNDPNLQPVFRMRRSEEWTPEDTAHRVGGLPMAEPEPAAWNAGIPSLHPKMKEGETISVEYLELTPPQRTWVTLTEDEILLISADCAASHQHTDIHFARAIEAKLRSKNT
jgi:hypothetical protein